MGSFSLVLTGIPLTSWLQTSHMSVHGGHSRRLRGLWRSAKVTAERRGCCTLVLHQIAML
jgi:hypothetical protein